MTRATIAARAGRAALLAASLAGVLAAAGCRLNGYTPPSSPNAVSAARTAALPEIWAVVRPLEARIALPWPDSATFRWNLPETTVGQWEYSAAVTLRNAEQQYDVGFGLRKGARAQLAQGDTAALFRAGESGIWRRAPMGRFPAFTENVDVAVAADSLIVTVRGRRNLELLFSGRPSYGLYEVVIPHVFERRGRIRFRYES